MTKIHPEIYALRPWYHDFATLGLQTRFPERLTVRLWRMLAPLRRLVDANYVEKGERFSLRQLFWPRPPSHQVNQATKEAHLLPFIHQAAAELPPSPACLDLFCADGYYSCHLARRRADARITGVDLDESEIQRAQTAARVLAVSQAQFVAADVWTFLQTAPAYDLILCTGGLYHLTTPQDFLRTLRPLSRGLLVVQSVVTLETEAADYFISPAPGWKHGSRFTHAGLRRWLQAAGWDIVAEARNELPGNPRPCDRGSSYFLCRAPA